MRVYLFGDSEGSKVIADDPCSAWRRKYIDGILRFIWALIRTGGVRTLHVGTEE